MVPEPPPPWMQRALTRAIDSCHGNVAELARRTGIARQTLQNWQAGAVSPNVRSLGPLMEYLDSLGGAAEQPTDYGVDQQAALAKIAKVLRDAGFDTPPPPAKRPKKD